MKLLILKSSVLLVIVLFLSCAHEKSYDKTQIRTSAVVRINMAEFEEMEFESRHFGENDWQGTLAMNVSYGPIRSVRQQVEAILYDGRPLSFLRDWEPEGEAHITTVTPIEYQECMWSEAREIAVVHMEEIEQIAMANKIQSSDLKIEGIGFGQNKFYDRPNTDQTHFIIVTSNNLLKIRRDIYGLYLERGGEAGCWNPEAFYPHITIGYTYKDIHFPNVEKNLEKALDPRVKLEFSATESPLSEQF